MKIKKFQKNLFNYYQEKLKKNVYKTILPQNQNKIK